jgi:asparagine synthase (glutamine-hydrolysing)
MRGGFVACLAATGPTASRLESAAACLRWHSGEPVFHRHGRLQIACLADDLHGPSVEISGGRLLLCHGAPPEPLELLERRDRFVGVESDGLRLSAIRDRMGEVPLFYRRVGDQFWLATEIQPLLAVAPAEPDLEWLAAFSAMVEYPETTGWLGVKRALPGEILQVDRELQVRSRPYYSPRLGARRAGVRPAEAAQRFRELLSIAVAKRSSERCGVLLSGGLDSSAVAVVAARTTRPTLLTISHPELPQVDETRYAQAIADATGIPLTTLELEPDPWDPADDIQMFGVPPLSLPTGMYGRGARALAAAGCEIALDGHDGDGTLGNTYAWAANTLLDTRPDRLARAAREYGSRFIARETVKGFVSPPLLSRLRRRPVSPEGRASFLPYFRGETALRLAEESRWQRPRAGWEHAQLRALVPSTTQIFEEFELFGARYGIDVQHPFADRELIEFLTTLPHAVKASTMRLKPLLRDALADLLPQAVAERDDKTDFTAVIDARVDFDACYRWIRDSGVRLPDLDYGRLFRDAAKPVNNRILWTRLASAHVFLAGSRA